MISILLGPSFPCLRGSVSGVLAVSRHVLKVGVAWHRDRPRLESVFASSVLCLGQTGRCPPRRHRPRSPRWPRAAGPKAACWAFPFSRGPGLFSSASASFAWRSAAGGRGVSPRPTALCVGRVRHSLHLRIGERTVFPLRFLAESSPATFSCWSCKH